MAIPGKMLRLPNNVSISQARNDSKKHLWQQFIPYIKWIDCMPDAAETHLLNPHTAGQYSTQYTLSNEELSKKPGIIKENQNKDLFVYLTQSLRDTQWHQLLRLCKKYNVTLHIVCQPTTQLPKGLSRPQNKLEIETDTLIVTHDIDYTVASLIKEKPKAKVIDISECSPTILHKMDVKWPAGLPIRQADE